MSGTRSAAAPVANWRLLPLFLTVLVAAFVFKAGHVAGDVSRIVATARAQEAPERQPTQEDAAVSPAGEETTQEEQEAPPDAAAALPAAGLSRAEMTLLQDLRARRQELEERARQVELQERLLASTERRIERRIAEMQAIEKHIAELVAQHDQQESAQLQSVVSMYEKMKPKEAAPIFQRLDIDIQVAVATRMKDSKMAALLAEMDPDTAKTLTTRLATREELPKAAQILDQEGTP